MYVRLNHMFTLGRQREKDHSLMLSHEQALVHARQHLYSQRPPVKWVWVLQPGQRVAEGWYFFNRLWLAPLPNSAMV